MLHSMRTHFFIVSINYVSIRKASVDMLAFSEGTSIHLLTRVNGYEVIVTSIGEEQCEILAGFKDHPFANRPAEVFSKN